ncbi:arylsulfatase [Marinilongibacter aquaticus]|uniref:sulfatase family protein n=1 Tax=Marinilongibacter aquaticus TaxID=2975157 RepID=UPI0021BDC5FF|nr:arylsulfatase [Marinilongibacter aquaticus]UBM60581.1 arylsulfatase [Marinilongibacter aquaticus]
MSIRIVKNVAFLAVLLMSLQCTSQKQEKQAPNIIFVLADDMGIGDVQAFNAEGKIATPNLDLIAAEGMRFTDAHTSSAVCTPTRYGIITGRYNWRSPLKSGVLTGTSKALIRPDQATVASMLKEKGYTTAFVGKWHLGWDWALKNDSLGLGNGWNADDFENIDFTKPISNGPNSRGFDYAYGHAGSLDMAPYVYVENGMATSQPDRETVNEGKYSWWRKGPTGSDFIHEEVTPHYFEKAEEFIRKESMAGKPFFLYLALPSPHTPILPTKEFQGKSGLNPYGDFVMMVDAYMGELEKAIKEAGIEENTLLVFTSDNGCSPAAKIDELQAEGHYPSYVYRGHKADIFEGGHRVPFIVKWPGKVAAGSVSDETICTTDFFATCAGIVGHEIQDNEAEDSFSILPALFQEKLDRPIREATVHHSINGSFAIRMGDWKLAMCPGSGGWSMPRPGSKELKGLPELQLYNLKTDPGETHNVEAENPEKVKELKALLVKYIQEGRSTPGAAQANDPIEEDWKQIEFTKN